MLVSFKYFDVAHICTLPINATISQIKNIAANGLEIDREKFKLVYQGDNLKSFDELEHLSIIDVIPMDYNDILFSNDVEEIKYLLETESVDVHNRKRNITPLSHAVKERRHEVTKVILEHDKNIYYNTESDYTFDHDCPIIYACENNDLEMIKILINNGYDINFTNWSGTSPLIYEAENGNLEGVKLLVKNGADIEQCDNMEHTPLFKAMWCDHYEMAEYLIGKGVEINLTDHDNDSIMYPVVENDSVKMAKLLIDNGYIFEDNDCIVEAVKKGSRELSKVLIEGMIDVSVPWL